MRTAAWICLAWLAAGCGGTSTLEVGNFEITLHRQDGTFDVEHLLYGAPLRDVRLGAGTGTADVQMSFGSWRFDDPTQSLTRAGHLNRPRGRGIPVLVEVEDSDGGPLGTLVIAPLGDDTLALEWSARDISADRLSLSAACEADDHFLGMGAHAMDVDHVGEAFGLWVSEPGIGKVDTDVPPDDWFVTGTRHASSFPVPYLGRPHLNQGLLIDTPARVELDLCASDPQRFSAVTWQGATLRYVLVAGADPVATVQRLTDYTGRPELPQEWVFAPWNDAVRGPDRVRAVAERLRAFEAPSSVIWSEDWRGAADTGVGYHLLGEWFVDETKYPDVTTLADELEADGFKWFAYFSPFLREGTVSFDEAVAEGVAIQDENGQTYLFGGVTFEQESLVDFSTQAGRQWAQDRMQAALDLGFDGWMTDYAEWLPPDAVLASGDDPMLVHNLYPEWWQETNAVVMADQDASFFVRSGWTRTGGKVPVVWAGDQRTSFDVDDGLPTVVAMGVGLAASGVPIYTHDVGGYQSVGNPPSDKQLWFRWASLGAFTPVLRTHHGAFEEDNWQFDTDDETTEHWAAMAREHMRLFPYRYGLAARASDEGIPMILPVSYRYPSSDWGRMDAWLLGDGLLVAPVLERDVTGRQVELPAEVRWFDWWTHAEVSTGWFDAAMDEIPVFVAAGTTIPTFAEAPDTLVAGATSGATTLADVDGARIVYLFGGGGDFTEADGTTYAPSGTATGSEQTTETLTSGPITVAGVTLAIDGPVERAYTVVVIAP